MTGEGSVVAGPCAVGARVDGGAQESSHAVRFAPNGGAGDRAAAGSIARVQKECRGDCDCRSGGGQGDLENARHFHPSWRWVLRGKRAAPEVVTPLQSEAVPRRAKFAATSASTASTANTIACL